MNRRNGVYLRAKEESQRGNLIGVCTPVLAELYFGAEYSQSRDRTLKQIQCALTTWRIWPVTLSAVREYGRLAAMLKRIGRPMQQFDVMIAAVALDLGNCTVVSSDSDFLAIPGLTVENWVAQQT